MSLADPSKLSLFDRMALIGAAEKDTPLEWVAPLDEKVASDLDRVKTAMDGDNEFSTGRGQRLKPRVELNVPQVPIQRGVGWDEDSEDDS